MVFVNTNTQRNEQSVDRQDRREARDHKKAKEEEVRQFESYFSEKHERESKADARRRETLYDRMQSMMEQKNPFHLEKELQPRKKETDEDIAETQYKPNDAIGAVAGQGAQHIEETPLDATSKDIHAVVKKVMDQQVVFSNMTVQISLEEDRKIDVSLLEQKGRMSIYLSARSQDMKDLMNNSRDILENELRSSVLRQQEFDIHIV